MRVTLDINAYLQRTQQKRIPVVWDSQTSMNGHIMIIDEADNPINSIATEGRKFGLALLCASQSPTHFSEDFLTNVATKILLRLDERYWDGSVKKLKIDMNTLKYIVPKKTLAVQIKTSDAVSARFIGVELESALDRRPNVCMPRPKYDKWVN